MESFLNLLNVTCIKLSLTILKRDMYKKKIYNRSKTQNDFSFDLEEIAEYKFYSNEWFC